jgi:formylglycine-generating enzyme required for sulfatase activity
VSRDCPVIPVLLPNAPTKPELPLFLRQFTWVDFRASDPDPMYQLRWGITGKKPQLTNSAPSPNLLIPSSPVLSVPQSPQILTEILPGNIKLEMVKIPAGSFLMGSAYNDESAYDNEKPQHSVNLQGFYLGKYPVTQEQYQAIMGNNPSAFKGFFKNNLKNPVETVSWDDAQEFCRKLSEKTGKKYRLPNEAEWEYACRAGTQTRHYFGDDGMKLGEYAWYRKNSDRKTHPVGQKKPNNWGLYDMHGNVLEWCEDGWHENYQNAPKDGSSWNDNHSQIVSRVIRGGSWYNDPWDCRSASRDYCDYRFAYNGFRVVSPQTS